MSLKILLQPIPHRTGAFIHKEKRAVWASDDEFTKLIMELAKKRAGFEEIRGQFRIFREVDEVMLELLRDSDILDSIEEDIVDQK